jgi:hypothetical protein
MRCVQTVQRVKVSSSPEGNQDSINLSSGSKIKFIIQFHAGKKVRLFRFRKANKLAKLMTPKVRRRVKPGSATFDSTEEAGSMIAAPVG